jgi:toxin ParE1/3/4
MTYRTTRKADDDIIAIYIRGMREFGAAQAERYHEGLLRTFEILADNPTLAREHKDLSPSVRLHPYGSHLIIYILRDAEILIVRVLHGRQDWERYL